ncbi:MAG: hypothetical protein EOO90_10235 [Pedobacter sp.]|nr:MAG: hypothetical protein EOO90_10235 [Pedobacter sp.]
MLKVIRLCSIVAALPFLTSCGSSESSKTASETIDSNAVKECYIAVDAADTAFLDLTKASNGDVTGNLLIKYAEKPQNKGTFAGKFSGDTLFVDYSFINGEAKTPIYKNPLAFLDSAGKLTLGVGVIETSMGRSYFVKDKSISFERGKFVFEKCKD